MPLIAPAHPQQKKKFLLNKDTSNHLNDQKGSKKEEKHHIVSANLSKSTKGSNSYAAKPIVSYEEKTPSNPYMSKIMNQASAKTKNNLGKEDNQKLIKISFNQVYLDELYQKLIFDEENFFQKIKPNYMSFQRNINSLMRAILVDWLIDVHYKCNMKKKTLFLCVFIIDTYLTKNVIEIINLQLLGMAALLIACKTNENAYPTLKDFVEFSANAYVVEQLITMEKLVLQQLEYNILSPTADEFFAINANYLKFTKKQRFFGEYLLDSSLIDFNLLKYKQSTIAVACVYIIAKIYNLNGRELIMNNTSPEVNSDDIIDCANYLLHLNIFLSNSALVATKNKYMSTRYMKVAELLEGI